MRPLLIAVSVLIIAALAGPTSAANMGQSKTRYTCQIEKASGKAQTPPDHKRGSHGHRPPSGDSAYVTTELKGRCPCLDQDQAARTRCRKDRGIIKEEQTATTGGKTFSDAWYAQP